MNYIEHSLGGFRRAVGIAIAKRTIGGDFAFGSIIPSDLVNPWGYNQTDFNRGDLTSFPIYLPQNCLIRISSISMTFNADRAAIGNGIFSNLDAQMLYFDENQNHIYSAENRHPEIFLCDSSGRTLVDIALPVLSTEGEHQCNYYFDTKNDYILKLFGKGMVAGVTELVGYSYLICYVGLGYEIISDEKAKKIRGGCL